MGKAAIRMRGKESETRHDSRDANEVRRNAESLHGKFISLLFIGTVENYP